MTGPSRWPPSLPVRVAIAAGLAILGVVLVWTALARPATPGAAPAGAPSSPSSPSSATAEPPPPPTRSSAPADSDNLRDKTTGPVLPESEPVSVSIPRIGVRSRLVPLGLDDKGEMDVPGPWGVGWFTRGATPGALGPAVIAGHVTWDGAPVVFHRLDTMRRGDRVSVTREDGRTAVFRVTRVAQFAKSRFPSEAVYGPIDHAGLRLITCGGTYDAAENEYLDNVIVFARLESVGKAGG
ncbi:MAG TPA: class F sortase [Propionibacteriaceae bacterium]|nr:class F sortase [Propionibacteriaceae bacterium]